MDYVFIEGLKVHGKHGVTDAERNSIEQEFEISIKMHFDSKRAAQTGNIEDALDYVPVREKVVAIIQSNNFYLIETLGEVLCKAILEDKRIEKVELKIRKTAVWDNGVPGIVIVRSN